MDGVLLGTKAVTLSPLEVDPGRLVLGQYQERFPYSDGYSAADSFDGLIAEVSIWSRVLSATDISAVDIEDLRNVDFPNDAACECVLSVEEVDGDIGADSTNRHGLAVVESVVQGGAPSGAGTVFERTTTTALSTAVQPLQFPVR